MVDTSTDQIVRRAIAREGLQMTVQQDGAVMVHADKTWGGPVSTFRAIVVGAAILLVCAVIVILFYRA